MFACRKATSTQFLLLSAGTSYQFVADLPNCPTIGATEGLSGPHLRRARRALSKLISEPMFGREIARASARNYRALRTRGIILQRRRQIRSAGWPGLSARDAPGSGPASNRMRVASEACDRHDTDVALRKPCRDGLCRRRGTDRMTKVRLHRPASHHGHEHCGGHLSVLDASHRGDLGIRVRGGGNSRPPEELTKRCHEPAPASSAPECTGPSTAPGPSSLCAAASSAIASMTSGNDETLPHGTSLTQKLTCTRTLFVA